MVTWPHQNVKWNYRKKRSTTESFIKKLQWLEGKKYHWTKDLTTLTFFQTKMFILFLYTDYVAMRLHHHDLHSPQILNIQ